MAVSIIIMGAAGRMGATLTRLAQEDEDLKLVGLVERAEFQAKVQAPFCSNNLAEILPKEAAAVIIDFTAVEASLENARLAAQYGNPIVIGTTGFSAEQSQELASLAAQTPIFMSPNMSLGINVLLEILPDLVKMLDGYDLEVSEIHHRLKKDSPSGTALRLAEALAEAKGWTLPESGRYCREGIIGPRPDQEIGVQTIRGGDVVGVHTVYCLGPGERIEISHQAHSRDNFANGALRAAKWLANKQAGRIYNMRDVLQK